MIAVNLGYFEHDYPPRPRRATSAGALLTSGVMEGVTGVTEGTAGIFIVAGGPG